MNRDELIKCLPEIEARARQASIRGVLDVELLASVINQDSPALCVVVREMADKIGDLQTELAAVRQERDRCRKALQRIQEEEGRVCEEFETCDHRACTSSYLSNRIAAEALAEGDENAAKTSE